MSPNGRDPLAGEERTTPTASRMATSSVSHGPAPASPAYSATMRRNEESWVEVASQPSSSSLSSITDEIVITGLRVGQGSSGPNGGAMPVAPQRRRRLMQQVEAAHGSRPTATPAAPASQQASTRHVSIVSPSRSTAGSSQEEYDETESEDGHAMSSSAENVQAPQTFSLLRQRDQERRRQRKAAASDGDDEEDDDDEGTALGLPSSGPPTFSPQPNAFSHPPTHLQHQQQAQQYRSLPAPHQHLASPYGRSSSVSQKPQQHQRTSRASGTHDFVPSHREDSDAALRASLTTLLSCAAAARGLSTNKKETSNYGMVEASGVNTGLRPSNQPMDIRLVPEAELMTETPASPHSRRNSSNNNDNVPPQRLQSQQPGKQSSRVATRPSRSNEAAAAQRSTSSRGSNVSTVSTSSKSKRSATAAAASGNSTKSPRAAKKKRTGASTADAEATATFISPTLLTWVVSAGVVVLVSVVGFGAGFVLGREVGRQEAASASMSGSTLGGSTANATSSCGREIMRSSTGSTLRRFRWGSGMNVVA